MKSNILKLISLLCVLCVLVAAFASCGGETTKSESKKETESNETESNDTDPETPYVPVELEYTTIIDGFKAEDWNFTLSTNLYGDPQHNDPNMMQEVWVDADGNTRAKNRAQFMGVSKDNDREL